MALLFQEPSSWKTWEIFRQDSRLLLWWATPVECVGAMARIEREGRVATSAVERAWNLLYHFKQDAHEIQPVEEIRWIAQSLLLKYPLRAADALQLAAALSWYGDALRRACFVALDNRLRTAALLEGFQVLPYIDEVHEAPAEWETVGPIPSSRLRLPGI